MNLIVFIVFILIVAVWVRRFRSRKTLDSIAFFHPYCNAGGGGERVLFCAIKVLLKRFPQHSIHVYTGDAASPAQILADAQSRFGVTLPKTRVNFIYLRSRRLLEADLYPVFTLLGQTLAGFVVGLEAASLFVPEIFIDSMGCPMTMPLFRLLCGCRVACYVHYPVISTDMIELVAQRTATYNNNARISSNPLLSRAKLIYYRLFAAFYGLIGRASHLNMVNGSWTAGHIGRLWGRADVTHVVYPPCDTSQFSAIHNTAEQLLASKRVRVISVAQFRPEKDHAMQLRALRLLLDRLKDEGSSLHITLVCVGGCRNEADQLRVKQLKELSAQLQLTDNVEFRINVPFPEMCDEMSRCLIGLHTMYNEHFGIGVVELMSSGTLVVAHDSGGPQLDIVVPAGKVGLLAASAAQYAHEMLTLIGMTKAEREQMRRRARDKAATFSESHFAAGWLAAMESSQLLLSSPFMSSANLVKLR